VAPHDHELYVARPNPHQPVAAKPIADENRRILIVHRVNRPLKFQEAHYLIASCVLPVVGGWLVNQAYAAHPEWEPGYKLHGKKHGKKKTM
jgi:hypothetical protein